MAAALSPSSPYVERSIAVISQLDPAELAERKIGPPSARGDKHTFHTLGAVAGIGSLGVKIARRSPITLRLAAEMPTVSLVHARASRVESSEYNLARRLPRFLGQLTTNRHSIAMITEDVSRGGMYPVSNRPMSQEAKGALAEAFCVDAGDTLQTYFDEDRLSGVAMLVHNGGVPHERLLSLVPSPLRVEQTQAGTDFDRLRQAVTPDRIGQLSIELPDNSPLVRSIMQRGRPE